MNSIELEVAQKVTLEEMMSDNFEFVNPQTFLGCSLMLPALVTDLVFLEAECQQTAALKISSIKRVRHC